MYKTRGQVDKGAVIWITGLSDSGKTTLAREVAAQLRVQGLPVILLDGDELRFIFGKAIQYDKQTRIELGLKAARLCQMLADQGNIVIIAIIGLFNEIHQWNHEHQRNLFLAYIDLPIETLRLRDSKGIYRQFDEGKLSEVYGLDLCFDPPPRPDLRLDISTIGHPSVDARKLVVHAARSLPHTKIGLLNCAIQPESTKAHA
jgi:adenylylsulfate kinase